MTTKAEFYFGLLSFLIIAFVIPLLVTAMDLSGLLFLVYLYLPIGAALMLHALYCEEKKYLGTNASKGEGSE